MNNLHKKKVPWVFAYVILISLLFIRFLFKLTYKTRVMAFPYRVCLCWSSPVPSCSLSQA